MKKIIHFTELVNNIHQFQPYKLVMGAKGSRGGSGRGGGGEDVGG